MSKIIAWALTAVAEGRAGPWAAKAYWWAKGKKTKTGAILLLLYGALSYAQSSGVCATFDADCATWEVWLFRVGSGLVALGLADGTLHAEPPLEPMPPWTPPGRQ